MYLYVVSFASSNDSRRKGKYSNNHHKPTRDSLGGSSRYSCFHWILVGFNRRPAWIASFRIQSRGISPDCRSVLSLLPPPLSKYLNQTNCVCERKTLLYWHVRMSASEPNFLDICVAMFGPGCCVLVRSLWYKSRILTFHWTPTQWKKIAENAVHVFSVRNIIPVYQDLVECVWCAFMNVLWLKLHSALV